MGWGSVAHPPMAVVREQRRKVVRTPWLRLPRAGEGLVVGRGLRGEIPHGVAPVDLFGYTDGMNDEQIRSAIRAARLHRGLSYRQLGASAQVSFAKLNKYLNGKAGLSVPSLSRLCSALGFSLEVKEYREKSVDRSANGR